MMKGGHYKPYVWLKLVLFCWLGCFATVPVIADSGEQEAVEPVSRPLNLPAVVKTPREQLQWLLDNSLNLARLSLQESASFYPFLAGLTAAEQVELVGVPAAEQRPSSETVILALRKAARKLVASQRFQAVALYVDYVATRQDTGQRQAGIRVELEHSKGDALSVFVPYFIYSDNSVHLMTPQFMPGVAGLLQPSNSFSSQQP